MIPDSLREGFQCSHPTGCYMPEGTDVWEAMRVEGTKAFYRDEDRPVGDLSELSIQELICGRICPIRYLDDVVCAPVIRKPALKVVSRASRKRRPANETPEHSQEEENDF